MKITWIGHSCFRIEKDGYAIVVDPYSDGSVPGLADVREEASAVLCTHEHSDHNFREGVSIINGGKSSFDVDVINTFHDDAHGSKRGGNRIFIISDGETRIAHLGDLGCTIEDEALHNLDVMLIPVGGFFTIDGDTAAEIVKKYRPRIAVPMHYRSDDEGFGFDVISTVSPFISHFERVLAKGGSTIESSDVYDENIVVLTPSHLTK